MRYSVRKIVEEGCGGKTDQIEVKETKRFPIYYRARWHFSAVEDLKWWAKLDRKKSLSNLVRDVIFYKVLPRMGLSPDGVYDFGRNGELRKQIQELTTKQLQEILRSVRWVRATTNERLRARIDERKKSEEFARRLLGPMRYKVLKMEREAVRCMEREIIKRDLARLEEHHKCTPPSPTLN